MEKYKINFLEYKNLERDEFLEDSLSFLFDLLFSDKNRQIKNANSFYFL